MVLSAKASCANAPAKIAVAIVLFIPAGGLTPRLLSYSWTRSVNGVTGCLDRVAIFQNAIAYRHRQLLAIVRVRHFSNLILVVTETAFHQHRRMTHIRQPIKLPT